MLYELSKFTHQLSFVFFSKSYATWNSYEVVSLLCFSLPPSTTCIFQNWNVYIDAYCVVLVVPRDFLKFAWDIFCRLICSMYSGDVSNYCSVCALYFRILVAYFLSRPVAISEFPYSEFLQLFWRTPNFGISALVH